MITLTPEDRAWMDEVVRTVTDTWNAADPGRPHDMKCDPYESLQSKLFLY